MGLNIVIDASGIFYRSLFTVGNYGAEKGEKLLDSRKSQGIFMRKLATDFCSLIRDIENPSRVIVCLDSSSWRKTVDIDGGGYKSNREEKRDESPINWRIFYELTDKFAAILGQKGYIISRIPGAEGDDLLFFWSRKLNAEGENVVLVTGDRDLLQTICKNENNTWTVCLDPVNNRKRISLTQEIYDMKGSNTNEPDLFMPDTWSSSEDVLDKLISSYETNIVHPQDIAVMKVILGDGGDTVPSVVTWPDKKEPEKMRSMTENNYQKILSSSIDLQNSTWEDLYEGKFVEEISSVMESLKKISVDRETVKKNLKRNCKLVVLSEKVIPEQIQTSFRELYKNVPTSIAITNRDAILGGTEWWNNDKTANVPKSYDLFGD